MTRQSPRLPLRLVFWILAVLAVFSVPVHAQEKTSPPPIPAEQHVFTLDRFTFESGATVPNVKVVYGTYGHLSPKHDNVILLPSHYMADFHGYEWLMGPGGAKITPPGTTFESFVTELRKNFIPGADANDLILQARTWERHDVGTTKGFDGSLEKALASIKVPVLYMPSETDLYFPLTDARYEARFIPHVTLTPIPSLWGHPAGAGMDPEDRKFLNGKISAFLAVPSR